MDVGTRTRYCVRGFVVGSWSFLIGFIVAFTATIAQSEAAGPLSVSLGNRLLDATFATLFTDVFNTVLTLGVTSMFLGSVLATVSLRYVFDGSSRAIEPRDGYRGWNRRTR